MEIEPAPINEEPINENNEIEDLYELNFGKLSIEDQKRKDYYFFVINIFLISF